MTEHIHNERGLALLVSIMAIIVVGGLLVGTVTAARLENRQAHNTGEMAQAFAVTELGLAETMANWYAGNWNAMDVMEEVPISGSAPQGAGSYSGNVRRLSQELFFLDVTGTSARAGSRQRLGTFVKLRPFTLDVQASFTSRGQVIRTGNQAKIDGNESPPAGWVCVGDEPKAAVRIPVADATLAAQLGCPSGDCILGQPDPIEVDPSIDDEDTFFGFGDVDWDLLTAMANKRGFTPNNPHVEPSFNGDGSCNFGDVNNWGDPKNPGSTCGGFFPIIYAPGDLSINVHEGQGILLVEGDLTVNGTFEFYGIVIVKGSFNTAGGGTGIHFRGAVMAANVDSPTNSITGNAEILYSSCAVSRAQAAAGIGARLRSRGWLQLFSTS